jgi:hypothetical protein
MKSLLERPWLMALLAGAGVLAAALALPLLHMAVGAPPVPADGLPWQVQRQGEAIRVFGLLLPGSTLADARLRWGDAMQLAVMAQRGEPGALEAYVERFDGGGVGGRLLLSTELPDARVVQLRENSARNEPVDADVWRYRLRADDLADTASTPLAGITFIAEANLDAATLRERFGAPAERWRQGDRLEHWLYPERGLAILLDTQGKEVLQYVAPADFERRLRAPLLKAGAVPAADPPR